MATRYTGQDTRASAWPPRQSCLKNVKFRIYKLRYSEDPDLHGGPECFHDLPGPPAIIFALTNPQNRSLKPFVFGFYKKSGFHFSEPDLLIRKEIKYPDPCHPLRKTLLCRHVKFSARFMEPKNHFFAFCSATLRIRATSGMPLFFENSAFEN